MDMNAQPQGLTPEMLAAITQAVVTAMAAMPAPQIAITQPAVSINSTDIVKPGKYKGEKGRDLQRFLSQCEAYWITANINNERTRILTALGLMEDKAAQWAIAITDHVAANAGALPNDLDTWDKLREQLKKYFGDATPEDTAIIELNRLCNLESKEKDKRDVGLYVTEFQTLAARISGLSDKDKEIRFTQGLPGYIFRNVATSGTPPANFDSWVSRSLSSYAAFSRVREREIAEKKPSTHSSTTAARPSNNTTAPRYVPPAHPQPRTGPVPMDVDASRTETRKCYNCNKVGHLSRNCPDPQRPRRVQATNAPDPTIGMGPPQQAPPAPTASDATIAAVLQQMEELRKENAELKRRLEEGF